MTENFSTQPQTPTHHPTHHVDFVSRSTCGSCQRVLAQIRPVVDRFGATLRVIEVDADGVDQEWAMEFGDRVPVVLVDDEEIGCWEIDNEDLIDALQG